MTSSVTQVRSPKAPRITASDALKVIRCILATHRNEKCARPIILSKMGKVTGKPPNEFVECSSDDGYHLELAYKGGMLVECLLAITPSGKNYDVKIDEGSVFSQLTIEDRKALTNLVLVQKDEFKCELIPAWILSVNGARPYSAHCYYEKDDGEKAVAEQIKFRNEVLKNKMTPEEYKRSVGSEVGFKTNHAGK